MILLMSATFVDRLGENPLKWGGGRVDLRERNGSRVRTMGIKLGRRGHKKGWKRWTDWNGGRKKSMRGTKGMNTMGVRRKQQCNVQM